MFETLDMAPPDPIIGLTEAFKKDSNPDKINLGVGVYKDGAGNTPILASVKQAERRLLNDESTKNYLGIDGSPSYAAASQGLLFGPEHEVVSSQRAVTVQSPGGTGALRVAADWIAAVLPKASLWLSDPTWANHPKVFAAAGLPIQTYPYFDSTSNGLTFEAMIDAFQQVPAGDVVLLHGCCHNPTGTDPTVDQWRQIGDVLADRGALALVDFAYQGFGRGLSEDARGLLELTRPGCELLVCSSFSKNFGIYNERVGALTVVAGSAQAAQAVLSHVKACVRANYSNPPSHGAAIVTTVLTDSDLRRQWEQEVRVMRDRINQMRRLFVDVLSDKGVTRDFSFLTRQNGMFSFSGLTKDQVERLRQEFAIYIVGSGRINVAGMTKANMGRLCGAIADVLGS